MLYTMKDMELEEKELVARDGSKYKASFLGDFSTNSRRSLRKGLNKDFTMGTTKSGNPKIIYKPNDDHLFVVGTDDQHKVFGYVNATGAHPCYPSNFENGVLSMKGKDRIFCKDSNRFLWIYPDGSTKYFRGERDGLVPQEIAIFGLELSDDGTKVREDTFCREDPEFTIADKVYCVGTKSFWRISLGHLKDVMEKMTNEEITKVLASEKDYEWNRVFHAGLAKYVIKERRVLPEENGLGFGLKKIFSYSDPFDIREMIDILLSESEDVVIASCRKDAMVANRFALLMNEAFSEETAERYTEFLRKLNLPVEEVTPRMGIRDSDLYYDHDIYKLYFKAGLIDQSSEETVIRYLACEYQRGGKRVFNETSFSVSVEGKVLEYAIKIADITKKNRYFQWNDTIRDDLVADWMYSFFQMNPSKEELYSFLDSMIERGEAMEYKTTSMVYWDGEMEYGSTPHRSPLLDRLDSIEEGGAEKYIASRKSQE